jgi:hypothetical protein
MVMQIERENPRISVNKLGEYLVANASRRRQILAEQKKPKTFLVTRYAQAEETITEYLLDANRDEKILMSGIQTIAKKTAISEHEEEVNASCISAITGFMNMSDRIGTDGLHLRGRLGQSPKLAIAGVKISIRPEVFTDGFDKSGKKFCGALKLYFSKNRILTEKEGEYIATLLYHFLEQHHPQRAKVMPAQCKILDVFHGAIHIAPKARVRRMEDIEAACEEINSRWDSV